MKSRPPPGATRKVDINEAPRLLSRCRQREFWNRVEIGLTFECWPWSGGSLPKGYGITLVGGVSMLAHRVAYVLKVGAIEPGLIVRHRCDNPRCCNPDHLETGTYADNAADKRRSPRDPRPSFALPDRRHPIRRPLLRLRK